ncbi:nicotinate (nicotinamide) nucleotide adenylyltransferase [Variovorax sp. KK3]|uniref:nicotinate (nicotinamide) nucleotide adenylyltransferase n=1 Tax=Variovorax sp. KK3 TaxID=1855728 RepID=UPI00097BBB3B|nr:nicotinate (nicotinamide) nucleotide adenylyltransferase [Variovorax sp. KK3]
MALKPPRVGVFGGAFDPPHDAHVSLVKAALAQLGLARLHILPTGDAWHKARGLSAGHHRLEMARLAFEGLPGAVVDDRELRRAGPTYTLDTLRELRGEQPAAELVLILGADQASSLPRWHGWQDILAMAVVAVAQRPGAGAFDPLALPGAPPGARFETLAITPMDVSATEIRAKAALGQDLSRLVPPAVARYIDQHHLYRTT